MPLEYFLDELHFTKDYYDLNVELLNVKQSFITFDSDEYKI